MTTTTTTTTKRDATRKQSAIPIYSTVYPFPQPPFFPSAANVNAGGAGGGGADDDSTNAGVMVALGAMSIVAGEVAMHYLSNSAVPHVVEPKLRDKCDGPNGW